MTKYEIYANIRNQKGFSDADVAKGSGIGASTFSDWKHGRSNPKIDKLEKIANFLDVSIDFLQYGDTTHIEIEEEPDLDEKMREKVDYALLDEYDKVIFLMEKFEKLPADRKALILRMLDKWGV